MHQPNGFEYRENAGVRILCAGDDCSELLRIALELDHELDITVISSATEARAALEEEGAFDLIIIDQRMRRIGGAALVNRLRLHSPDAERLIIAARPNRAAKAMASDCRVMRILQKPCEPVELCRAVGDALMRHRARTLRAAATPSVTPVNAHLSIPAMR